MYKSVNILNKYCPSVSWYDIYYGLIKDFIVLESVSDYAIMCLERGDESDSIINLAIDRGNRDLIISCVKSLISFEDNDIYEYNMELAELKWKYCSIKDAIEESIDNETLFDNVNAIYADFNHPLDMEKFISYLPACDGYNPSKHSKEENENRLINNMNNYLNEIKSILEWQCAQNKNNRC